MHTTPIAVRYGESGDSAALDEIQRQPSVYVLGGPATVITNFAAASALLADGWSTESVSRVVRTMRTRQKKHEREHAEHVYNSHIHDGVTISNSFAATGPGFEGEEESHKKNRTAQDDEENETDKSLSELQKDDTFRGFMRTWDIHQIATCVQGFLQR